MKNNLNYKNSPLPFQGQKRGFLKAFTQSLTTFPNNATYVDLFGGSGLLSRTVKDIYSEAKVIYNDYDNFSRRIQAIPNTNELLKQLRPILDKMPRKFKVPSFDHDKIIAIVEAFEKKYGYVDYITLSASLLFSGKYATSLQELKKQTFYNRIRLTPIPVPKNYLNGLEVVNFDYRVLFEQYKDKDNVVFLLDPPYLSTDTSSYNSDTYWKLKDYLDVLDVLQAERYFYFTSNKSNLVELCEWFGKKFNANPFQGAIKQTVTNSVNYQCKYEDIMLYK